jgi:hypothetical protein
MPESEVDQVDWRRTVVVSDQDEETRVTRRRRTHGDVGTGASRQMTVTELAGYLDGLNGNAQRLVLTIGGELQLRDPHGAALAAVDDPGLLAREVAGRILSSARAWVEHLGPMYDVDGVATLLSRDGVALSKQAVHKRRNLLALKTGSGRVVYPAFQFTSNGVLAGLEQVLEAVPATLVSPWTLASWLMSPDPDLDQDTPVQVLRDGGVARVVAAAQDWARALAA